MNQYSSHAGLNEPGALSKHLQFRGWGCFQVQPEYLLNFRHILFIINLLFFIAGPVTATSAADATPTVLEKVSLQLSWKHQFQFAGFYTAVEQGYFAEQGLEVEIREFQVGADPIVEVPAERADFGIYSDELIFDRMEGKPVVLLANYFKRFPLVFLAQPGLQNLADLKGERLMISSKGATSMTVRAAFHKVGLIPGENLELVPSSFNIDSLVRGEVDAMAAFRSNEPL